MAKKHGNWLFLCNFVGMKKDLIDIIRKNKDLQKSLLEQEGGIVSYLARHLDADGQDALYEGYRDQCLKAYRDEHKWSMGEEMMKIRALDDDHIKKELAYQVALRPVLLRFPDASEHVLSLIADYMGYAFKKSHLYSTNAIGDQKFYEEVIIQYHDPVFGMAHRCLWLVLNEHRGKAKAEKHEEELWEEFKLQRYAQVYFNGMKKLREAVKELIDEKTRKKTEEQRRQICRDEAKKVMEKLKSFTRKVNGDCDLVELHLKEDPRIYHIWSTKELEQGGATVSFIEKAKRYITKEEMAWLRQDWFLKDSERPSPLHESFLQYYHVLEEIGNIWAIQLREYDIDIHELEEETGCILNKRDCYWERSLGGLYAKVMKPSVQGHEMSDEEKRQRLETTNKVIKTHNKMGKAVVNLLELHKFLALYFADDVQHKYEWYALRRFLLKYDLLKEGVDNVEFEKQMNHPEWFGYLEDKKQCSQDAMNDYNILNYLEPQEWCKKWTTKVTNTKARQDGVDNIYKRFNHLENHLPLFKDKITNI